MDLMTYALCKGNGGSGLPSVTSEDNGKVLAVKDGAWAADSNLFVVTLSGSPLTSDKTFAEIVAAVDAGKTVVATQGYALYQFAGYTDSAVDFVKFTASGGTVTKRAIKTNGSVDAYSTATVPPPFAADNGSELIVKNGVWNKQQKKFIVTLTPTAQDFSGVMDKTIAEMTEAYNAGMQIVWRVIMASNQYVDVNVTAVMTDTDFVYPSFNAYVIEIGAGVLVYAHIPVTNDGTVQTYSTVLYALTPVS